MTSQSGDVMDCAYSLVQITVAASNWNGQGESDCLIKT